MRMLIKHSGISCYSDKMGTHFRNGFTLIELSIVLVIIGLVIGGILVGQDLVKAATYRAQISQIEKYNAAVNSFQVKYGYLPGDLTGSEASAIGFITRSGAAGHGDQNGFIESCSSPRNFLADGIYAIGCETTLFWSDLS